MNNFFTRFFRLGNSKKKKDNQQLQPPQDSLAEMAPKDELGRKIDMIFTLLVDYYGSDKLVIKAGKMDALHLVRSPEKGERVLALQKIIFENPTLTKPPAEKEIPAILDTLTEKMSDILARRSLEADLEQKVADRLEENHQDYVQDIRRQVLQEEKAGETPMEQQKRQKLEAMEQISLTQSVMELLRPKTLTDIVGQERAVASLLAKLSSPYPQPFDFIRPSGSGQNHRCQIGAGGRQKEKTFPLWARGSLCGNRWHYPALGSKGFNQSSPRLRP